MSSSKQIDLKKDFAAGIYLSEAQNQREGCRGATVHKAGSKIPTGLTVSPV